MAWRPDYITSAQAKAALRIADAVDDTEIAVYITTASRAVDDACGRQFGKVAAPEARTYTAEYAMAGGRCAWMVSTDDLATVTGLVVSVGGTAVTDYTCWPRNAVLDGKVWTRIVFGDNAQATPDPTDPQVTITGSWGWPAVPSQVVNATKLQVARFAARRDSPYGIAGSPSDGSELRLLAKLDPDVRVSLAGLVRGVRPR